MQITAQLKDHLVKNFGLPADAAEDAVQKLVGEKMASGELSLEVYKDLTKSATAGGVVQVIAAEMSKQLAPVVSAIDNLSKQFGGGTGTQTGTAGGTTIAGAGAGDDGASLTPVGPVSLGKDGSGDLLLIKSALETGYQSMYAGGTDGTPQGSKAVGAAGSGGANPAHDVMMGGAGTGAGGARVKSVAEMYTTTKADVTYDQSRNEFLAKNFSGHRVMSARDGEGAHALSHPSQLDKAVTGSWFKLAAISAARIAGVPIRAKMTDHDNQLVDYALRELPFTGAIGVTESNGEGKFTFANRKLFEFERKSLLDDALSGGLEAAPIAFDDAVIITPLLHGELFPLVNLVTVTRGRRIEAFSIGNPTFSWGTGEGTNIPLFNTDSLIAAFDNTIFPATGAMTMGLDFEDDTPNNIGDIVMQRYGEGALVTLDQVVAIGDGVTQPQGVVNASGTATINAVNAATGPWTISDYSALQFGLAKEFRNNRSVYISNDVTYQRSRNLKVDPATTSTDERRLFGMNFQEYRTMGYSHRIQRGIGNRVCGFFDLGRYRMYRRAGLSIRVERAGRDLALSHQQLLVCRMRFGGSLELGGAGALCSDGQS